GRTEESLEIRRELLPVMQRVLGADHAHTLTMAANLGASLDSLGRHAEAVELFTEVARGLADSLGAQHSTTLYWRAVLAYELDAVGRTDEARELIDETVRLAAALDEPLSSDMIEIRYMHAALLSRWGRFEEALAELEPSIAPLIAARGLQSPRTQKALLAIADNAVALGRDEVAAGRLRQASAGGNDFSELSEFPRLAAMKASGELDRLVGKPGG
ncbi:MAG TPA: tetratricopeptide repeat protein, partial [Steroidobacteraceae bacterium]|nr:tetratricopeptide repeat protein [Steroidobacteraceae bacterium]